MSVNLGFAHASNDFLIAALLIFGAETLAGYALGGVNLLSETVDSQLTPATLLGVFAIGTLFGFVRWRNRADTLEGERVV